MNANEAAIIAERHTFPETFQGSPFLGGASLNNLTAWIAPGSASNEARHKFSLNTCNGCHGAAETGTAFLHVFPREPGVEASLSGFLTGTSIPDPVTGEPRAFNDLGRRNQDLRALVCGCPLVTPKPPRAAQPKPCAASAAAAQQVAPVPSPTPMLAAEPAQQAPAMSSPALPLPAPARDGAGGDPAVFVDPTMISVAHWGRLNEGELFAMSRHIDWAVLMKRTWGLDVMRCPAWSHRLRVVATLTERAVVRSAEADPHPMPVKSTPGAGEVHRSSPRPMSVKFTGEEAAQCFLVRRCLLRVALSSLASLSR
ncbi:hypothetical protein [Sorangium sp. So ce1099]|uniref:hypothetical protein n=1 Tax=Sorangium sp. So ce1099 TaxID=3133331 RepID=UPI003F61A2BA